MKLCILSDASSLHIVKWAKFFVKKGYIVSVISDIPNNIDSVKVYTFPKYEYKLHIPIISSVYQIIRKAIAIRKILKLIQPDILHTHFANIYGFLGSLTGFHPHIATCHGSDLLVHSQRSLVEKYFVKRALKHADKITLPSSEMLKKATNLGIDEKKIIVIQYGIDLNIFRYFTKRAPNKRFICTRLLVPRYQTDLIIKAFSTVLGYYPDCRLDIVGSGPALNNLKQLVGENSMENHVRFLGKIEHSEIVELYNQASFYITASPTDGLSISLLEAFATGTYPIVPDNPSNRSLSESGFNVKLFVPDSIESFYQAIIEALGTIDKIPELCLQNRLLVKERFDQQQNLSEIEQLYNMLTREFRKN